MSFSFKNPAYSFYERRLTARILAGEPVEHVAIIQDGNRRYAMERGLSKFLGHSLGAETSEKVSDWCLEVGVKHLTLYAFSTENFAREETEKRYLFDLIRKKFIDLNRSKKIHGDRVRV